MSVSELGNASATAMTMNKGKGFTKSPWIIQVPSRSVYLDIPCSNVVTRYICKSQGIQQRWNLESSVDRQSQQFPNGLTSSLLFSTSTGLLRVGSREFVPSTNTLELLVSIRATSKPTRHAIQFVVFCHGWTANSVACLARLAWLLGFRMTSSETRLDCQPLRVRSVQ